MDWHSDPEQRRQHHSLKWSTTAEGCLPMWVADMDCAPPPVVAARLKDALAHGIFGYGIEPAGFREAWVDHLQGRYGWIIDPEWIVPIPGVVPAMRMALMAHPEVQEVITPTPIYPYFSDIPKLEKRVHTAIPMARTCLDGSFCLMPSQDALAHIMEHATKTQAVFWCNPQNPGGTRYQEPWLADLCAKARMRDTLIVSDEIWADLVLSANPHIPLGKVADPGQPTITLFAATKTFNIAGFPCAVAVIPEATTRERMQTQLHAMAHVTPLAYQITMDCLREGQRWHEALLTALRANQAQVQRFADAHPALTLTLGEAGFLAWFDGVDAQFSARCLARGVRVSPGAPFGQPSAFRLNFGCSPATLTEALHRIDDVLTAHPHRSAT